MLKLTLQENQKEEFINYSYDRINGCNHIKDYSHITKSILSNTFDFFLKHRLTVEANAKSYWYNNSKKEIECYGYSGYSINERDNEEGIIQNLYHEIFCKAEWLARGIKDGYSETCKSYFGRNYNKLIN
jgi:hypothetical protein